MGVRQMHACLSYLPTTARGQSYEPRAEKTFFNPNVFGL